MKAVGLVVAVAGVVLVGCTAQQDDASIGTASSSVVTTTTTTTTAPSSSSVVAPSSSSVVAPSTVTVQSTVTSTVEETVVVDTTPVLGHTGFGPVRLGMTRAQLEATGLVEQPVHPSASCLGFQYKDGNGTVWIQEGLGVMAILVEYGARTAEGLPVDLHPDDPRVARTYPGGERTPNGFSTWVGDDVFYFISGGTTLARRGQACFN